MPNWWTKPLSEKGFDTYNAEIERVREATSYRHTLDAQRCLVPTSWFYESTGPKGSKTKHKCSLEGGPLLLLGLWDYHRQLDLLSFTILTTGPGITFEKFHHRVPGYARDSIDADSYMSGGVDVALEIAMQSNGDDLSVDPPEPVTVSSDVVK